MVQAPGYVKCWLQRLNVYLATAYSPKWVSNLIGVLAGVFRAVSWVVSYYLVIFVYTLLFGFFPIEHLDKKVTGLEIFTSYGGWLL